MTVSIRRVSPAPIGEKSLAPVDNVASTAELRAHGVSTRTVASRSQPGGPWRRLLPGVVLLADTAPTRRQMLRAAMTYLGPEGIITGRDALRAHGLDVPVPPAVHVLVPATRRVTMSGFVVAERTTRLPVPAHVGGLPHAPPARAALDAARRETDPGRLRQLLTMTLVDGRCTLDELETELGAGSQRGSAAVRVELRRLADLPHVRVRGAAGRLVRSSPLPPPRWRQTVCDQRGNALGTVDAWWDEIGLGWQLLPAPPADQAQHLGILQQYLALTAAGVVVVRTHPERLHTDTREVVRELASAFRAAARRPRPNVQCDPLAVAA